jgi:hypothetical protein
MAPETGRSSYNYNSNLDFKAKLLRRDKEGNFILKTGGNNNC